MARVIPDPLPGWVVRDPLRSAERRVLGALRAGLGEGFTILYSRPFVGLSPTGAEVEGEADFVIIHPSFGLLFLEIKGGAVGRDQDTGEWRSVDRDGIRHRIKNPVEQVQRAKHMLVEKIKNHPTVGSAWIPAGMGVVLPDSMFDPALGIGADTPRELFACVGEMKDLPSWVRHRFGEIKRGARKPFDAALASAVVDVLAGRFQLRSPLAADLLGAECQTITLTENQYFVLEFLRGHPRAAIGGAAGSGKTMLAIEKALRFAVENPGSRVLLTCFNRPLGRHLRSLVHRQPNVIAGSFHEICGRLALEAGVSLGVANGDVGSEFYASRLPEALLDAIRLRPELGFDAVVVDEGQDFSDDWLDCLQLVLGDSGARVFWLFYDDNQSIYGRLPRTIRTFEQPPYSLTQNVRNTQRIFDLAVPFLSLPYPRSLGPEGREVVRLRLPREVWRSRLAEIITDLVEVEGLSPSMIAVLVPRESDVSVVAVKDKVAGYSASRADSLSDGSLVVDTVRRFKGLERAVVILFRVGEVREQPELSYVGITRARQHLVVIESEGPDPGGMASDIPIPPRRR